MLGANGHIVSVGGTAKGLKPIRLGLGGAFVSAFLQVQQGASWPFETSIVCGFSSELAKNFSDGSLDVACLMDPPLDLGMPIFDWHEDHVWVRSPNFVLSPGSAIPIVDWPVNLADQPMFQVLERAGIAYRIVFTAADHQVRMMAVRSGLGITCVPTRLVDKTLVIANEYYLPAIPPLKAGVFLRSDVDSEEIAPLIDCLKKLSGTAHASGF
jgi:DNA-binding transcriptional LysR family regulator